MNLNQFREINKLTDMLTDAGIPCVSVCRMQKDGMSVHVCYPAYDEVVCSAVVAPGSYGYKQGLIEIMGLLTDLEKEEDDVVGWLKADDVFCRIKKHWDMTKEAYNA
jgi:hypothetical protein